MRIVTFNVQHGRTPLGPVDTAALAHHCARLEPDVLALQEVDAGVRRSGRAHQAMEVARATGMVMVFAPARRIGFSGRYGNALLVRGGVADVEMVALPRSGRHERRVAVLAGVEVDGRRVSVAATHLSVDRAESVVQLDVLLEMLGRRPLPRLVFGDLNLRPDKAGALLETAGFTVASTSTPTYPAADPVLRIDHVAVEGLELERVTVLDAAPVSDHRPLLVEAAWPAPVL
jgi:endonuclease/exonuclease/phosphatase family metal-dependent hydrolase